MSPCLSGSLSVCISFFFLSFCLYACLCLCVSDSLSLLVRLCQSLSLCFNMFICLARYLDISIIRCIHLSIILSWYHLSISSISTRHLAKQLSVVIEKLKPYVKLVIFLLSEKATYNKAVGVAQNKTTSPGLAY